ncbi:unnamed protein product [Rhizoctonia solani]|uniref:Uncharacterized protein n=1 Tax=Rhizoctonia solani TaxID=456999 RepID=A0A8H3HND2_9AGAM|nr:unnamed protein product [Rhizoctonia solani]CAE7127558.1 unnamed protein product [Rhizoctonia solani]
MSATVVITLLQYDGTSPGKISEIQSRNASDIPGGRIPIHGVVVGVSALDDGKSIATWSDGLKSRLPPGIGHTVCCGYNDGFYSCSTTFDSGGAIISRETNFSYVSQGKMPASNYGGTLQNMFYTTGKIGYQNGTNTCPSGLTSSAHLPTKPKTLSPWG